MSLWDFSSNHSPGVKSSVDELFGEDNHENSFFSFSQPLAHKPHEPVAPVSSLANNPIQSSTLSKSLDSSLTIASSTSNRSNHPSVTPLEASLPGSPGSKDVSMAPLSEKGVRPASLPSPSLAFIKPIPPIPSRISLSNPSIPAPTASNSNNISVPLPPKRISSIEAPISAPNPLPKNTATVERYPEINPSVKPIEVMKEPVNYTGSTVAVGNQAQASSMVTSDKSEIEDLTTMVQEQSSMIAKLQELEVKMRDSDAENERLMSLMSDSAHSMQEVTRLELRVKELEVENSSLRIELENKTEQVAELEDTMDAFDIEVHEKKDAFTAELAALNSALLREKAESSKLSAALENAKEHSEAMSHDIAALGKNLEGFNELLRLKDAEILSTKEEAMEEKRALTEKIEALASDNERWREKLSSMDLISASVPDGVKQLKAIVDELRKEIVSLKAEENTLRSELSVAESMKVKNLSLIEQLLEENSSLIDSQGIQRKSASNNKSNKSQVEELKKHNVELSSSLNAKHDVVKRLSYEKAQLEWLIDARDRSLEEQRMLLNYIQQKFGSEVMEEAHRVVLGVREVAPSSNAQTPNRQVPDNASLPNNAKKADLLNVSKSPAVSPVVPKLPGQEDGKALAVHDSPPMPEAKEARLSPNIASPSPVPGPSETNVAPASTKPPPKRGWFGGWGSSLWNAVTGND